MLFFNHPKPPNRKEVAVQMVRQEAALIPDLRTIVVEAKRVQPEPLQEKLARPEPA